MSLDAQVSSYMHQVRQMADTYNGVASSLAQSAHAYAQRFALERVTPFSADVSRQPIGGAGDYPRPPLPESGALDLPAPPDLRAVPGTLARFVEPVPGVRFLPIRLRKPTARRIVDPAKPGRLPPPPVSPDAPALEAIAFPALSAPPSRWNSRAIEAEFQEAPAPHFPITHGADFDARRAEGFAILRPYLDPIRSLDGRIAALEAEIARLSGPPDLDAYEREKYAQSRSDTDFANRDTLLQLEAMPSNASGLPDGAREFSALDARLKVHRADAAGALAARIARLELELTYLQAARGLQARALSSALDLLSRSMDVVLSGVDAALDASEGALDAALQAFALERRKLEAYRRFNAAQRAVLDDRKRLALSQIERLDIAIAGERLKAKHDRNALDSARAASGLIERKLALFNERLRFVETDIEGRGIALDAYEAKLKLHAAKARLKRAEIELRDAEIKDDLTEVAAQLKAVERATLAVQQEAVNLDAQKVTVKAQSARNKATLERFQAAREAYSSQYRLVDEAARVHLRALEAGQETEFKARELAIRKAETANVSALQDALRELDRERVIVHSALKRQRLSLSRLAATGAIESSGAAVIAGMGAAAAAGANTLVTSAAKESL